MAVHILTGIDWLLGMEEGKLTSDEMLGQLRAMLNLSTWTEDLKPGDYCQLRRLVTEAWGDFPKDREGAKRELREFLRDIYTNTYKPEWNELGEPACRKEWRDAKYGGYYKVLKRKNGKLYSAVVPFPIGMLYEENARMEGKHGPCLVFSNLDTAEAFAYNLARSILATNLISVEIWECRVENPRPVMFLLGAMAVLRRAKEWWSNPENWSKEKKCSRRSDVFPAPKDTVAVDALVLTKEVEQ